MNWTKKNEVERSCAADRPKWHTDQMQAVGRFESYLLEHIANRDWYAVERIANQLQQIDPTRAFDHVDVLNYKGEA